MKTKPKCSCYGGFDCEVCNPDEYDEQHLEIVSDIPLPSRRYTCVACGSKGRRANKPEQRLQDPICPRCHANCDDLVRLMEWQASCLERNSTDTPRTDAAKSYWDATERENCVSIAFARRLEIELTHSLQNQVKTQAEVERLKELVNESIFEKSNLSIALVNCQADLNRAIDVARMLPVIPIPAISSRDITDTLYAELNQLKATLNPTEK